jgi:hypothetical protein
VDWWGELEVGCGEEEGRNPRLALRVQGGAWLVLNILSRWTEPSVTGESIVKVGSAWSRINEKLEKT